MDELVLAEHGVFLTTDARGDMPAGDPGGLGLYYRDTRFLSVFTLRVDDAVIPLLGARNDGYAATFTHAAIVEAATETPDVPSGLLLTRRRYLQVDTPASEAEGGGQRAKEDVDDGRREGVDGELLSPSALRPPPSAPRLRERIELTSYNREALDVRLTLTVAADYRDIFAVRSFADAAPGAYEQPAAPAPDTIVLAYTGRDNARRRTVCHFAPAPTDIVTTPADGSGGETTSVREVSAGAHYDLRLEPRRTVVVDVTVALFSGDADKGPAQGRNRGALSDVESTGSAGYGPAMVGRQAAGAPSGYDPLHSNSPEKTLEDIARPAEPFERGLAAVMASHDEWLQSACTEIETDNEALNRVLRQGLRDLRLLLLEPPTGPYIAAGIPRFAVPFGRDGIITALEMLSINPAVAVGTLRYLAAHQGREVDPARDEEPGKIMHEMRAGELARSGRIPFNPYYGTVDATPLFLVLLGRTLDWLGDDALAHELEPAMRAALRWLDDYGDLDGDGYIEFERRAGGGLANQGWKDSGDSLQFPDGAYPAAPIALVEAQGYAYEARLTAARVLRRLGDETGAGAQERKAAALRERFNRDFWLADQECYAQALDRDKRPVPAVTSNAGHPLWSGIADEARAAAAARRLLGDDMCSGWGIRTLATGYPSYNPISYHNGSIWPHDTAIVAAGLKRYGHDAGAAALLDQVVAAAQGFPDARLPELYGGLPRQSGEHGPVPYPVSCSPQAWAAGSVYLLLQSALGLEADTLNGALRLRPVLPPDVRRVCLRRLRVGGSTMDLLVERRADGRVEVRSTAADGAAPAAIAAQGEVITVVVPAGAP